MQVPFKWNDINTYKRNHNDLSLCWDQLLASKYLYYRYKHEFAI